MDIKLPPPLLQDKGGSKNNNNDLNDLKCILDQGFYFCKTTRWSN